MPTYALLAEETSGFIGTTYFTGLLPSMPSSGNSLRNYHASPSNLRLEAEVDRVFAPLFPVWKRDIEYGRYPHDTPTQADLQGLRRGKLHRRSNSLESGLLDRDLYRDQ